MYFSFYNVDKPIPSDSITSTADLLLVLSITVPYTTMGITDVVDSNNTINGIVLENYPDISLHHIEYTKNQTDMLDYANIVEPNDNILDELSSVGGRRDAAMVLVILLSPKLTGRVRPLEKPSIFANYLDDDADSEWSSISVQSNPFEGISKT